MAENAIEIIVDVLTSEGITSLDELTTALKDALKNAGLLSGSVDNLDTSLTNLTRTGASTDDMAVGLAKAIQDAGVNIEDTSGLVAALATKLRTLGAAGKEAATGVDAANKANEGLTTSADSSTGALDRQGAALRTTATEADLYAAAIESARMRAAQGALAEQAAVANLGEGYAKLETMAGLATPALMKAATWAGLGLAGLAYEGIKQYTQFNRLITQTITQAGEAPSKMGFLTNLAESVAKTTGQNLDDVANSIYRAASGTASWNNGLGATKKQLTDIVTQVSKLNVLGNISGGAESEQASRVITALINANIRGVGRNPALAAALTNAAVGSGDMRLGDLVPGIGRGVLQSAVANNVTAKDAFAWIADLTSTGTTASVAGNYVKTGINLLANPSAQGTDVLSMIGIKPGEIGRILSSPGGLVSAAKTLKEAINQLNPSSVAGYFFNTTGQVRAGGSGLQGAINKLQTMSANSLSPQFIKDWEAGKLTTAEKQQAFSLILDKAYGGSKQFATIASILNNPQLLQNIEGHITAEDNLGYLRRSEARAEATPSQQFKKMEQSLLVDLVNIGKDLTKPALVFGHIITDTIGVMSKFKGVIYGIVTMAVGLLGFAGFSKLAELGKGISPYIGAGYNRLSLMAGKDSKFSQALEEKANNGRFHFLDIYKTKRHGILSKIGGESISAGGIPGEQDLSADGRALNSTGMKTNVLLEQVVRNTGITATATTEGDATGMGGVAGIRAAESRGSTIEREASGAVLTPRDAMYIGSGQSAVSSDIAGLEEGSIFYSASSKRWMKKLSGGRQRFASKAEVSANGGSDQLALGPGDGSAAYLTQRGASGVPDSIALPTESSMGGVDMGLGEFGPATSAGITADLLPEAGSGILSGLGETLGGLAGGPIGMMAMMMGGPALISALTPALGKLAGLFGDWLGGTSSPYNAKVKGSIDVNQASAKVKTALKAYRQYQIEHKNKAGDEVWSLNEAAFRADPAGYIKALTNLQRAKGTYTGALGHAGSTFNQDLNDLYGGEGAILNRALKLAKGFEGTAIPGSRYRKGMGTLAQIRAMEKTLPLDVQKAINKDIQKNGGNSPDEAGMVNDFQSVVKAIRQKQSQVGRQFNGDFSTSSLQDQMKYFKAGAYLNEYGFVGTRDSLATTNTQLGKWLRNKKTTVSDVAKYGYMYAQPDVAAIALDNKALADKQLPPEARTYIQDQKKEAEKSLQKMDELIREAREASKHTHLSDESISKLSKNIAQQITGSTLASQFAEDLAPLLNRYLKQPVVQGTSGGSTKTVIRTTGPG